MKVSSTARADALVRRVMGAGREQLVMVLGTGCCDSTAPFLYDRYYVGPDVEQVGALQGVPIYAQVWLAGLYPDDELQIDVDEGVPNDSFSLESEFDCRFALRVARRDENPPA